MDPPELRNEDDDVFVDPVDDCPAGKDPLEPSGCVSTLCNPEPLIDESRNSHPQPPSGAASPATTLRRRLNRRGSFGKKASDLDFDSSIDSESDLINGTRTSFKQRRRYKNHRNWKENENVVECYDSIQGQVRTFPAPSGLTEENNEQSTITTAANDDTTGDTADSAAELGNSSLNFLELIAGLVIKAIGFQIHLFVMFVTYPMWFLYYSCVFFIDPFRTMRRGKDFFLRILSRVRGVVSWYIGPPVHRLFEEHQSIWKVALRFGWGFLWSIYVCFVLFSLLVSSLAVSGFMIKHFMEKPIQKREILNFDYTKQSPVAYVPIISCAGIGGTEYSENNIALSKWMDARIIPPKHKVQVSVSLSVPESEYNRNLGIFQVRVDLLSTNGKTIASSSQPCILRFRSEPIRLVLTFLKIAPLITGYISETQTLNVKMRGFIEEDVPTSCLRVTLEQRAEYRPGAGIPELYDASLLLESELPCIKRIIWYWKMSIFIWITMMVFMMKLLFLLVCCRPIIIPRTRQRGGSSQIAATQNNPQAQS